jgi:TPR repeat protein
MSTCVRLGTTTALACVALLLAAPPVPAEVVWQGDSPHRHGYRAEHAASLELLAQEGDPFAQFALAVMYDDGRGLPQDFSRALAWYTRAAKAGLVEAQYMVGRFHGGGRGVKQNPGVAFYWFNLAAAGGHPFAPRLRDQHRNQITPAQRRHFEAQAVAWQSAHPRQFRCHRCTYPSWTAKPRWWLR